MIDILELGNLQQAVAEEVAKALRANDLPVSCNPVSVFATDTHGEGQLVFDVSLRDLEVQPGVKRSIRGMVSIDQKRVDAGIPLQPAFVYEIQQLVEDLGDLRDRLKADPDWQAKSYAPADDRRKES